MKVLEKIVPFIILISLLCMSCAKQKKSPDVSLTSFSPDTFTLHFWDKYDFKNANLDNPKETIEPVFVDYLQTLNRASNGIKRLSINALLDSAINNNHLLFSWFVSLYEKYLYNPNSPIRNEELYLNVLQFISKSPKIGRTDKIRYKYQLCMISKNRIGEIASDFEFIYQNRNKENLSNIKADYLIVFFNNPDCHDCSLVKQILSTLNNSRVKILSIFPDDDLALWEKTTYPKSWINGYNNRTIHQLYDLKAIPTLYLLDQNKRIILKDAPIEEILKYINDILIS